MTHIMRAFIFFTHFLRLYDGTESSLFTDNRVNLFVNHVRVRTRWQVYTCEIEKPRDVFSLEKSSAIGPLGSDQRPSLFCLDVGEQNVRKDHWPRLKASCTCHRKIFACCSRHQRSINYCVSADEYPSLIVTSFYLTN